ncbi:MAG: hypothetical protein BWK75_02800 [Candidatus Altiarchaeales archaeon A3]|nr:MAG: hypothetical protein BWK75_02800 [Candidatus Altiarchaeales archaeon A3]
MKSQYLKLITWAMFILVFVFILFISGCLNNEENKNKTTENTEDTNNTIISEKDVKIIKSVHVGFENLTPTGKLQIDVGDIYVYNVWDNTINAIEGKKGNALSNSKIPNEICDPAEADIFVYVDKIERINKSDYYIVRFEEAEASYTCYTKEEHDFTETKNTFIYRKNVIGINKDKVSSHIFIPTSTDAQKPKTESDKKYSDVHRRINQVTSLFYFPDWITCLDEKTKFIIDEVKERNGKKEGYYSELTVVGSEKVNGFDCFKVEQIYEGYSETYNQKNRYLFYVDKNRRIIVKMENYLHAQGGHIPMQKIELKEIKKSQ